MAIRKVPPIEDRALQRAFCGCCMSYRLSEFGSFRYGVSIHDVAHDPQIFVRCFVVKL